MLTFDWHRFIVSIIVSYGLGKVCAYVVHTPLVGIKTCRLVSEQDLEEVLAKLRVCVQE
jgi:hypothetical protein